MRFKKQSISLEVSPIDSEEGSQPIKHSTLLPNSIRCLICGPSNCGKTNVMVTLLLHKNGLKFKNLYLYTKTPFQSKYCFLKEVLLKVPEIKYHELRDDSEIIHPNDALSNTVIIFDDVVCENQINIRNYFAMGRHRQIDCFYLSQTYSKVPKQLIRDNANLLLLFKQDETNLKHVYNEHVNSDMSWNKFKDICHNIWQTKHSFLTINKDSELNKGRYRKNLDTFIYLS